MKTLTLFLMILVLASSNAFSQQTSSFKERTYLIFKKSEFRTLKGDPSIVLQYISKDSLIIKNTLTYRGTVGSQDMIFYQIDTTINYDHALKFNSKELGLSLAIKRLFGEIKQDKDVIYFYPWRFRKPNRDKDLDKINNFFSDNRFLIKIPDNTIVKISHTSWQIGTLLLPVKWYLKSKADTLKNNIAFDANLNFMIGKKWGKKKYYFLSNATEGDSYTKDWSLNMIIGISKLDIDDSNTTPKTMEDKYSIAALSYGLAGGFQYKKIGVFVAGGIDSPMSKFGKNWNFKNKPWIGFGLGLGIN